MAHSTIIAIGASAGGVGALRTLAGALPETFSAPILAVLHIGPHRSELPAILNAAGPITAKHAEDGEKIAPGHIYLAPPDRHMVVVGGLLRLLRGPKENCARPAIDPLFRSVAENYGANAVGVVLTGNLNDGTSGLYEIKRCGGIAVAQDSDDAAYPMFRIRVFAAGKVEKRICLFDVFGDLSALADRDGNSKFSSASPLGQFSLVLNSHAPSHPAGRGGLCG